MSNFNLTAVNYKAQKNTNVPNPVYSNFETTEDDYIRVTKVHSSVTMLPKLSTSCHQAVVTSRRRAHFNDLLLC